MLRLPEYRYHRPTRLAEVEALLAEHGAEARLVAGGTDLIPNMKHRLFEPAHLIGLSAVEELRGINLHDDTLDIGAATTLDEVSRDPRVREHAPALAEAARHVAGPQIRNRGTLGGNLCLDTRCTYYNQTEFWRTALGFCLKKDGDTCHVTRVGKKCVAAHSADTPPVLMVLDAEADGVGASGAWSHAVKDLFVADGIHNTRLAAGDIVTRIRIPVSSARRCVYRKLRQRQAVDFPLLTVAVAADRTEGGFANLRAVVTGLGSRPRWVSGWDRIFEGGALDDEVIDELAQRAWAQCHPLENMIVDPEWRRAMVPVEVTRALKELRAQEARLHA